MSVDFHSITSLNDEPFDRDGGENGMTREESNGHAGTAWVNDPCLFAGPKIPNGFDYLVSWEFFPFCRERRDVCLLIEIKRSVSIPEVFRICPMVEAIPPVTAEYSCPEIQGLCGGYGFHRSVCMPLEAMQRAVQPLRFVLEADVLMLKAKYEADERKCLNPRLATYMVAEHDNPQQCVEA